MPMQGARHRVVGATGYARTIWLAKDLDSFASLEPPAIAATVRVLLRGGVVPNF
jgi:hypothetical protein